MAASSQYSSPFFLRLHSSPRHSRPAQIVFQRSRYTSGPWTPDFSRRGLRPMTSSRE